MPKRTQLSKKTRFDVFKRDKFKCQYCGQSPPATTLQIDHIVPVCEGGLNDRHNLTTSCVDCNSGKGGRTLTDVPVPIQEELEKLAEQREQSTLKYFCGVCWKMIKERQRGHIPEA